MTKPPLGDPSPRKSSAAHRELCGPDDRRRSIDAARGHDENGRVNALVTFADRTQAVVSIQVP